MCMSVCDLTKVLMELSYVAVPSEVLQQLDLAQGALGENLFAEDIGDLLDGYTLARLVVGGGAVTPLSAC